MDYVFGVQVLDALDYLVDERVDQLGLQAMLELLDQVQQVALEVLEDEVDLALLLEGLLESHHEVTLQHLQHLDFPLDGLARKLILVPLLELLYRHSLTPNVPITPDSRLTAFQTIP